MIHLSQWEQLCRRGLCKICLFGIDRHYRHRVSLFVLAIHIIGVSLVAIYISFPGNVDELAHYSYVRTVYETPLVMPGFGSLNLIEEGTGRFSTTGNYLNHPPLYYWLIAPIVALADYPNDIVLLRLCNVAISTIAIAILLLAGIRSLREPIPFSLFALTVGLAPMSGYLGGTINNDNLGILGTAIIFYAFAAEPPNQFRRAALFGFGFLLAAGAKLHFGLAAGLIIVVVHVSSIRQLRLSYLSVLSVFIFIGTAPYLLTLAVYGQALPPSPGFAHRTDWSFLPFTNYLEHFLYRISRSWALYQPGNIFEVATFTFLLLLFATHVITDDSDKRDWMRIFAALAAYLCIHFYVIRKVYLASGYPGGMQFRYYLAFWPFVALAAAQVLGRVSKGVSVLIFLPLATGMMYASAAVSMLRRWL